MTEPAEVVWFGYDSELAAFRLEDVLDLGRQAR